MNLYQVSNKGNTTRLIAAESEERAKEIAMSGQVARKIENLRVKDITAKYVKDHSPRGFKINEITEGFFFQRINGPVSTWETFML